MSLTTLTNLISAINGIASAATSLYDVKKRSALHVKAAQIEELSLKAREWAFVLNAECDELEKRVKELGGELEELRKS